MNWDGIFGALIILLCFVSFYTLKWGDDKRAMVEKDHWKFMNSWGGGV